MKRAAFVAGLAAATSVRAGAQAPPALRVDALTASVSGDGSKTLVLIPGLACGAWVWDTTIKALAAQYTVYTVTFDGFDGAPPTKPPYVDAFVRSVKQLVETEHLHEPILVGHSLGGVVALRVAIESPAFGAGIVVVDAYPLFPPLRPGETMPARRATVAAVAKQMLAASVSDYAAYERRAIAQLATNPEAVDLITERSLRSDRATTVGSFAELATTDLTPRLPSIAVPVLAMPAAPTFDVAATQNEVSRLYAGTRALTVAPIANSRHFIMLDQPAAFVLTLTGFVNELP